MATGTARRRWGRPRWTPAPPGSRSRRWKRRSSCAAPVRVTRSWSFSARPSRPSAPPRFVHASASAGVASLETRTGMTAVRTGLAIYGLTAAPHLAGRLALTPALTWRSRVHRVADVVRGTGVSYGHVYRLPRDGRIATVPVGYGDGLARTSHGARLLVHGTAVPIAGRIAMEHVMLD